MKNEILDAKTGDYYKITRSFFGGLRLAKTWDGNNPRVRRFGTDGFIFDEAHVDTKLRLPKKTSPPLTPGWEEPKI